MSHVIVGTILEKDFRPRFDQPPEHMCYLMIEDDHGKRETVHIHRKKVDDVVVGDKVKVKVPGWPREVAKEIEVIESVAKKIDK